MSATRILVTSAVLAAAVGAIPAAPVPRGPSGLVVHEWGTFSSFSGADGLPQKFYPEANDLPPFVYSTRRFTKGANPVYVSLETPVLYFHTDRPLTATVRADFPAGSFTEWFPQARPANGKTLTWADIKVRPGDDGPLPTAPGPNRYYAAREVPAAAVEVPSQQASKAVWDREKFLFYRGVGGPKTPLGVQAHGGDRFSLKVNGDGPVAAGLLIEVKGGKVRFRSLDPIPAGTATAIELPPGGGTAEPVRASLVNLLVRAGLFEAEARAMVKTWESAWFGDEGTRVLYVLPTGWTDRTLPLKVTPAPDKLVRVMVGRHDVLTPEREAEIDGLARRANGPDGPDKSAAEVALAKLGRFAVPARQQADVRIHKTSG
jgi:hypothetical protein